MTQPAPTGATGGTSRPLSTFQREVYDYVRAGFQIICIETAEEQRVELEIQAAARHFGLKFVTWDFADGLSGVAIDGLTPENGKDYRLPAKALDFILNLKDQSDTPPPNPQQPAPAQPVGPHKHDGIFVMRDLDDHFKDLTVARMIETASGHICLNNNDHMRMLVILTPQLTLPPKLKSLIKLVDFKLPTVNELLLMVENTERLARRSKPTMPEVPSQLRYQIANACLGLTSVEVDNLLSYVVIQNQGIDENMLTMIQNEKAKTLRAANSVLTYTPPDQIINPDDIGGYDGLLEWLDDRNTLFTPEAAAAGMDTPRGFVLIGPPGTGKSVAGELAGKKFHLPVYLLDIGTLFGSLVGESEARTRAVLAQVDAMDGSILVLDEVDKALGGAHEATGDSGATRRVFGILLSWMAKHHSKTVVVMTMNRADGIPPELLRAGRVDQIFYTELPDKAARQQILEIHLRKRRIDPSQVTGGNAATWDTLLEKTDKFVGSELEEAVKSARTHSWRHRQSPVPSMDELLTAVSVIRPMAIRDADNIAAIQEFCKNFGRPVSQTEAKIQANTVATTTPRQPRRNLRLDRSTAPDASTN